MFNFRNTYTDLPNNIFTFIEPEKVSDPEVILFNRELAEKLDINPIKDPEILSGNKIKDEWTPIAQAYAGHQYGHLNILGDGRAVLLGEHVNNNNKRFDIQLKGSGKTPYSRGGDGRGTLYSMIREYVISYSMEQLGIPTTKTLAVVSSGDTVYRETPQKGGIAVRVAKSHIRVGTFQFVALQQDINLLREFTDYVINRHYPTIKVCKNPYLELLKEFMNKQIDLVIEWYRVGFIHGVMNTDNVSISGETIDYGPCAFMDNYNSDTVFSSIDHYGRYSFGNQKNICGWNIARFSECIIPLIDKDTNKALEVVNSVLDTYKDIFNSKFSKMMSNKIGIKENSKGVETLIDELLSLMEENNLDYTKTFRELPSKSIPVLDDWFKKWEQYDIDIELLLKTNPSVIPRNHIVENILNELSNNNNIEPLNKFLEAIKNPYLDISDDYYKNPPKEVNSNYKTYCGT